YLNGDKPMPNGITQQMKGIMADTAVVAFAASLKQNPARPDLMSKLSATIKSRSQDDRGQHISFDPTLSLQLNLAREALANLPASDEVERRRAYLVLSTGNDALRRDIGVWKGTDKDFERQIGEFTQFSTKIEDLNLSRHQRGSGIFRSD